jgi:hypothetical protein
MMVEDGFVIGEICHIEAAEEGGERYNDKQSDDERRDFDNLILFCPTHHTITNNVFKYFVEVLKGVKTTHETKYDDKLFSVSDDIVKQAMRIKPENDLFIYQETLEYYRNRAKVTITSTMAGSNEYAEAIKLFYRCDGAIQILNWVLGLEADTAFNLPPIAQKG